MSKTHEVCGMTLSYSPDGKDYCPWCNVNVAPKAEGQSPSLPPGSPSGVVEALRDALDGMEEMIGYVPEYFRNKWNHQDYIDRAKKALASLPQAPATPAAAPADAGAKRYEDLWIVFSDHLFKPSIFQTAADGHAFLRKHKRGGTMHRYKRVSEGSSRVEGCDHE